MVEETETLPTAGTQETETAGTKETGVEPVKTEETFIDPKDLPPDMLPHFKRMQRSFTKRVEQAKSYEQKARMVDDFYRDPVTNIKRFAQQYGLEVVPAGQNTQQGGSDTNWDKNPPKSWEEVEKKITERAEERATASLLNKLAPVFNDVYQVKRTQIENVLDEAYPSWREHEEEMGILLQQHPTLQNDPEKLVRLVMPKEEIEGRAMQKALKKLKDKGEAGKVGGGSQPKPVVTKQNKAGSFADAVNAAKKELGIQ